MVQVYYTNYIPGEPPGNTRPVNLIEDAVAVEVPSTLPLTKTKKKKEGRCIAPVYIIR